MPPPYPSSPLELPDHWHRRGREDPTHIWWSNSEFLDMRDLTDLMSFFWPDVVFRTMFCFTPEDPSSTTIATNKNNTKNCTPKKNKELCTVACLDRFFKGKVAWTKILLPKCLPPCPPCPRILPTPPSTRYGHQKIFDADDF